MGASVVWVRAGGRYQLPSARRLWYYQNVLVLPKHGKIVNRKGNTKKATWSPCDRARSRSYDTTSDGTQGHDRDVGQATKRQAVIHPVLPRGGESRRSGSCERGGKSTASNGLGSSDSCRNIPISLINREKGEQRAHACVIACFRQPSSGSLLQ